MKLLKYINFLESVLTVDELDRKKAGTNKLKGDVLVDKLSGATPSLTLDKPDDITNPDVIINNASDILTAITTDDKFNKDKAESYFKEKGRYVPKFLTNNGEFSLNKFKKTIDFGGLKGAGVNTRLYESIQILYIAYSLRYPNMFTGASSITNNRIDTDDLLVSIIKFLQNFIVGNETEESKKMKKVLNLYIDDMSDINRKLLEDLSLDPNWSKTFTQVPIALYNKTSRVLVESIPPARPSYINVNVISPKKKYSLYHVMYKGNSPVVTLMNKYNEFLKSNKSTWGRINFAKYCPGDLYIVETSQIEVIDREIDSSIDINDLTSKLNNFFDNSMFIPVSLKKVGGGKNDTFDVIINGEKGKKLPSFEITNFLISEFPKKGISSKIKTNAKWSSISTNIETSIDKVIGFDSSNTSRNINVDGEVEGDFSRHGKISFIAIYDILKRIVNTYNLDINNYVLNSFNELKDKEESELEEMIENLHRNLKDNNLTDRTDITVDPVLKWGNDIEGNKNKLISKLQSLQIIYILFNLEQRIPDGPTIANDMMTKIMRYALSIATDSFETPRYLRII